MDGGDIREVELRFLETPFQELRIRDRKAERALLISLEETGQQFPIVVIPAEREGFYIVIDGHRRARGLGKLRRDLVRAQILTVSASDALLWVRVGQAAGPLKALEHGLLIRELVEVQNLSLDTVAVRFARSKSWVSRHLDLVQVLPEPVRRLVIDGRLHPSTAMKVLVPLARANEEHAQILAGAIVRGKLSTRDAERLYAHYRSPNPQIREALLADPLKFLAAEDAYRSSHDQPESDEQDVLDRLERLTALAAATRTRVRKVLAAGPESPSARRLIPAAALAWQALEALRQALAPMMATQQGGRDDPSREKTCGLPLPQGGEGQPVDCTSCGSGSQHRAADLEGRAGAAGPSTAPA